MAGSLPISDALAEASPESLTELLSRDPMSFQKEDRSKVVEALRAMRAKWEVAEASGGHKRGAAKPKSLATALNADALGL